MTPKPLTPEAARQEAQKNFDQWSIGAGRFLKIAEDAYEHQFENEAAFLLHQTTERLYHCALLTLKLYSPKSHLLKDLRKRAEEIEPRLIEAWPRNTKFSRRCFERLDRAYVEARYSPHFEITSEELDWLVERIKHLQQPVEMVCLERTGG